jgi:signal transduction histidine kinase
MSAVRLTDFIQQDRAEIVGEWVAFARTLLPWAKGMTDRELQDHADELLKAIVADMKSYQTKTEQSEKSQGLAEQGALGRIGQKHASDRLDTGLNLNQLVSEYRALRASVLRRWEEAHGDRQGDLTRFNEAIDETLTESTTKYSEKLNKTREQFLAILGHDLRNPIAAILMSAKLLTNMEGITEKHAGVAARIIISAERMNRMVSDLLDLTRSRLGAGIPITAKPMDLSRVCRQVIAEVEVIHPDCSLRFESLGDMRGEWDTDRLTQVISNLVTNAVQYGGDHGVVSMVAEEDGEEIVLRVTNKGPLIPENALKVIFDPMVRQRTQGDDKNADGLGLGLYIAHEIVVAHGGTIGVTSTAKEGTTFTVRVPRRPPADSPGPTSS